MSTHTDYVCKRLNDTLEAVEHISELQAEICLARQCGYAPDWLPLRHESGLINANRLLANQAALLIDDLEQSIEEVRRGR